MPRTAVAVVGAFAPFVPLLQVYSNPAVNRVSPQTLFVRSAKSARDGEIKRMGRRGARQMRAIEIDRIVERYRVVRNIRQVAREFGVSRTTVARHLTDRGIDTSRGMSAAEISEAVRLYSQGLSSGQIGRNLGFDNHTILNAVRGAGLNVRESITRRTRTPNL